MVFQGLTSQQAEEVWRPFFDWVAASPQDFALVRRRGSARCRPSIFGTRLCSSRSRASPSPTIAEGAPADDIFWTGNLEERALSGTPTSRLGCPLPFSHRTSGNASPTRFFAAAQHGVTLHVNKGLAGGTPEAIAAARETAMNPAVVDAFALVISGALGQPAYPGVPGHEPDAAVAQSQAEAIDKAMNEIRKLLPRVGSYVWETDFFQPNWQDAFWGENYPRLRAIKDKYDPAGLFFLHHGVGSEDWSADGFTRAN